MSDIAATHQAVVSAVPQPGTDTDVADGQRPDTVLLLGKGGYGDAPRVELDRMVAAVRSTGRYSSCRRGLPGPRDPGLVVHAPGLRGCRRAAHIGCAGLRADGSLTSHLATESHSALAPAAPGS